MTYASLHQMIPAQVGLPLAALSPALLGYTIFAVSMILIVGWFLFRKAMFKRSILGGTMPTDAKSSFHWGLWPVWIILLVVGIGALVLHRQIFG